MKKHRNPILLGVISRVQQLLERYKESNSIKHRATKGSLREAYLKEFLADFVPHGLSFSSGFVTDNRGEEISPQLDLVVFDPQCLPSFVLSEFATIVPLEAVRLVIEVKSKLVQEDFKQIKAQQDSFRKMRLAKTDATRRGLRTVNCNGIPQFVVAFESACSQKSVLGWLAAEPALDAVCVINEFCMQRDPLRGKVEITPTDDQFSDVMQLISRMHKGLAANSGSSDSQVQPDLGLYVAFDVPDADYDS